MERRSFFGALVAAITGIFVNRDHSETLRKCTERPPRVVTAEHVHRYYEPIPRDISAKDLAEINAILRPHHYDPLGLSEQEFDEITAIILRHNRRARTEPAVAATVAGLPPKTVRALTRIWGAT